MNLDNQAILNAILGLSAQSPTTTFNTGVGDNNAIMGQNNMQAPQQMQQPQMVQNTNTISNMFGRQAPNNNMLRTPMRHTPGRDSWTSGIGLDHQSILKNIGLGGQ